MESVRTGLAACPPPCSSWASFDSDAEAVLSAAQLQTLTPRRYSGVLGLSQWLTSARIFVSKSSALSSGEAGCGVPSAALIVADKPERTANARNSPTCAAGPACRPSEVTAAEWPVEPEAGSASGGFGGAVTPASAAQVEVNVIDGSLVRVVPCPLSG